MILPSTLLELKSLLSPSYSASWSIRDWSAVLGILTKIIQKIKRTEYRRMDQGARGLQHTPQLLTEICQVGQKQPESRRSDYSGLPNSVGQLATIVNEDQ